VTRGLSAKPELTSNALTESCLSTDAKNLDAWHQWWHLPQRRQLHPKKSALQPHCWADSNITTGRNISNGTISTTEKGTWSLEGVTDSCDVIADGI